MIAALLLTTGVAKLVMLLSDPFATIRVGVPEWVLWGVVAIELCLAFANLYFRRSHIVAFVNFVVFSLFAVFALWRWHLGFTTCGCSGQFELPVWLFAAIDIAIVAWLTVSVEKRRVVFSGGQYMAEMFRNASFGGFVAGGAGALLAFVFLSFATQSFGATSLQSELAVSVENIATEGDLLNLDFVVENPSVLPVEIIGLRSSCSCLVATTQHSSRRRELLPLKRCVFKATLDRAKIGKPLSILWYVYGVNGYEDVYFTFTIREDLSYD